MHQYNTKIFKRDDLLPRYTCNNKSNLTIYIILELPCKPLDDIPHGLHNGSNNNYGTVVQYTCDKGYSMVGSNTTTCIELQQWSHPSPICQGLF